MIMIIKTIEIIEIIKTIRIIEIIKKIEIVEIIKIIKIIRIVKSIMSCMSFFLRGQWSTDKILSVLVYTFIVLFPVWAGINHSGSCLRKINTK